MEREIVTPGDIKRDLLTLEIRGVLISAILVALMCLLLAGYNLIFHTVIITAVIVGLVALFLFDLTVVLLVVNKIRKGTYYTVRTDVLVGSRECVPGTKWRSYRPYRLYFGRGHFDIPPRKNYKWSYSHAMDEKTIFDTAFIDDTFTLIETKKKVVMVYNNKFFDVQTEQPACIKE